MIGIDPFAACLIERPLAFIDGMKATTRPPPSLEELDIEASALKEHCRSKAGNPEPNDSDGHFFSPLRT